MLTPSRLIKQIKQYNPDVDKDRIKHACEFAKYAHRHQKRSSGEPYFQHPLEVAGIMTEMKLDEEAIITALLHDTVEDTEVTLKDIEKEFGKEVCQLVDGVTKLTQFEYQSYQARQAENFRKLLLAMSEDIRVLLVKLSDRLHNMRTLSGIKKADKRKRIAHETMEIYAPLAERIGMQQMKNELQDLSFAELHPDVRQSIITRMDYLSQDDDLLVDAIITHLIKLMEKVDINAEIFGRKKTPCSIWRKMQKKNIGFEQLADVIAFRIIVDSKEDCYRALGAIHTKYHMIPEGFRDYISTPKNNGYASIHTVIMGPEKQVVEIQIRTREMHEIAEYGVAAHWTYKQGRSFNTDGKQFSWIRSLLEILEQAESPEDFLEHTKLEMYFDQVFCFTPRGDLIALPRDATPVDFAYAVHSDVGHHCTGAKVNGHVVPLRTILRNGDQVDIICSDDQVPSPTWEEFVITGKARSEIRRFIRSQQRREYINLGRAIILKEFKEEGRELKDTLLEPLLDIFNKQKIEDIYEAVGSGFISRSELIKALFPNKKPSKSKAKKNIFSLFRKHSSRFKAKAKNAIPIKGLIDGMAVHFGECCHPLPGDKIVGIVNRGKGIAIHTTDCQMLENYADMPERWIEVAWEKESHAGSHLGRLKVIMSHETGSLATLTNTIAKELGNISNLKITKRSTDFFEMSIDVDVRGAKHLNNIITALRAETCIHSVERVKH